MQPKDSFVRTQQSAYTSTLILYLSAHKTNIESSRCERCIDSLFLSMKNKKLVNMGVSQKINEIKWTTWKQKCKSCVERSLWIFYPLDYVKILVPGSEEQAVVRENYWEVASWGEWRHVVSDD